MKVAGHDGSVVQFKMKRHTSLSKLMKAYCERQGLSMRQSRFRFDGRPINEADTPTQLSWTMRTTWMCSSSNWGAWPAAHWGMAWRERHVCWGIAATRPCQTQGCAETQRHSPRWLPLWLTLNMDESTTPIASISIVNFILVRGVFFLAGGGRLFFLLFLFVHSFTLWTSEWALPFLQCQAPLALVTELAAGMEERWPLQFCVGPGCPISKYWKVKLCQVWQSGRESLECFFKG